MKANPKNNYAYNKKLQPYANKLRKNFTKAEACMWKYALKARQMRGYQFRRQRPVLNYIADFMCKELLLVIEVDGITHLQEEVIKKDRKKEQDLKHAGFTVIRFTDNEVLRDIQNVRKTLEVFIDEFEEKTSSAPTS